MFRDGERVSYIGDDSTMEVGSTGRVLASEGNDCHVMWESGERTGAVDLVRTAELVGDTTPRSMSDEMPFEGSLVTVAVREVYARGGSKALFRVLANEGFASDFPDIAEQVIQHTASLVRTNPMFREVIAQLGEEADDFVYHTVGSLLVQAGQECG